MYNEIKMATTGIITCYSCKLKNLKTPVVLHLAVTCMHMSIIVQYVNTSFSFYNNHQSCKHVIINWCINLCNLHNYMYIVSKFLTARKIENNSQKKKLDKPLLCCLDHSKVHIIMTHHGLVVLDYVHCQRLSCW